MIISHKHKFIFLKTTKTAGTSIEIGLSRFCGPDDVITRISTEDEEIRNDLGYPGPQNIRRYLWRRGRYHNHMSAKDARRLVGRKTWNSYYKFCFERNPWDRVISYYYWKQSKRKKRTLSEFIRSPALTRLRNRGYLIYTIRGIVAVDRLCRYEDLEEELEAVRTLVGIPDRIHLPHAKGKTRKDRKSYREILTEADAAIIADAFQDEINLMGYEW